MVKTLGLPRRVATCPVAELSVTACDHLAFDDLDGSTAAIVTREPTGCYVVVNRAVPADRLMDVIRHLGRHLAEARFSSVWTRVCEAGSCDVARSLLGQDRTPPGLAELVGGMPSALVPVSSAG